MDINLINNLSPDDSNPISSSESYSFSNLHEHVKWEILKQLSFKDYRNLAFICKKWYQTAVSAPCSVKPVLKIPALYTTNGHLTFDFLNESECSIDHELLKFNLFPKVKCESLNLTCGITEDLMNFILVNRSKFEFDQVFVNVRDMDEEKYSFLKPLFDMSSQIRWDYHGNKDDLISPFFEDFVSHRNIYIYYPRKTDFLNIVLKQWILGERPNLEHLEVLTIEHVTLPEITLDVEEFVKEKCTYFSIFAKIVVSGLPDLVISSECDDNVYESVEFNRIIPSQN